MKRSLSATESESKGIKRHHENLRKLAVSCRQYDKPFPYFRKPVEIGSFSQDYKREFRNDRRQLRYYSKPSVADPCFDLNVGYASLIRKDENVKEYLNDMLKWLIRNTEKFALHSSTNQGRSESDCVKSIHTDFVCWRGLLTKLLCTPYENRDDWKIAVTKFRGTFYLCEFETEAKKLQKEQITQHQDEMSYWGWKFEQYVTSDEPNGKPETERPVNNNEGFCSVVRTRLHSHSLVFGGEVDAWDASIEGSNKYVEMKTSRLMESHRQEQNFKRFKLIKWWGQSFLLGITKIVAGFRDDDGIVHSLRDYQTQKIPSLVQDIHNAWQPNVCFNFLEQVLNFIKEVVTEEDPQLVHLLTWSPKNDVECRCVGRDSTYSFLPDWFVNWKGWSPENG